MFCERVTNALAVDKVATEAGVATTTLDDQFGSKTQFVADYLPERDVDYYALIQNKDQHAPWSKSNARRD